MTARIAIVAAAFGAVLVSGCATHYRVVELDLADDAAIAHCGRANGRAGWLQRIDEAGDYVEPPARAYCVTED